MRDQLKELLLDKSFKLGRFKLASGRESDYYIDGRIASLDPKGAFLTGNLFLSVVTRWKGNVVGGLTLGADPIVGAVVALSYHVGTPVRGFIVRKKEKSHGTQKLVEGVIEKGDRAVVVEDVVTTGASALQAVDAVREMGAEVIGVIALVDREEGGREEIERQVPKFEALFTASELKKSAKERQ